MKVRIINGARGATKTVNWRESKTDPLERKAVRNVDFVIGDMVNGEFAQSMAQQRLVFPVNTTARDISTAVTARARELVTAVVADPDPVDIDL